MAAQHQEGQRCRRSDRRLVLARGRFEPAAGRQERVVFSSEWQGAKAHNGVRRRHDKRLLSEEDHHAVPVPWLADKRDADGYMAVPARSRAEEGGRPGEPTAHVAGRNPARAGLQPVCAELE